MREIWQACWGFRWGAEDLRDPGSFSRSDRAPSTRLGGWGRRQQPTGHPYRQPALAAADLLRWKLDEAGEQIVAARRGHRVDHRAGHGDLGPMQTGQGLDPAGDVDGIAGRAQLRLLLAAEQRDDHRAEMDADADRQRRRAGRDRKST